MIKNYLLSCIMNSKSSSLLESGGGCSHIASSNSNSTSKSPLRHKGKTRNRQRPFSAFLMSSTTPREDLTSIYPPSIMNQSSPTYGGNSSSWRGFDRKSNIEDYNHYPLGSKPISLRRSTSISSSMASPKGSSSSRSSLFLPLNSTNQKTPPRRRRKAVSSLISPSNGITPLSPNYVSSNRHSYNGASPTSPLSGNGNVFSTSPSVSPMSPVTDDYLYSSEGTSRSVDNREYSPFGKFACSPLSSPNTPDSDLVSPCSCSSLSSSPGQCSAHRFFPSECSSGSNLNNKRISNFSDSSNARNMNNRNLRDRNGESSKQQKSYVTLKFI